MGTKKVVVRAMLFVAIGLTFCAETTRGESGGSAVRDEGSSVHPGEPAMPGLPIEFDVAPANRLYVDGFLIEHVLLTTQEGDSLCLNGIPILPHRPCPDPPPLSDESYQRLYGSIPFVQESVESGASIGKAAEAYLAEADRVVRELYGLFAAARESGYDRDSAAAKAREGLRAIDTSAIVDWNKEVKHEGNYVLFSWKGRRGQACVQLLDPHPVTSKLPDETAKRKMATQLYELLGQGEAPCWFVISCGGSAIALGEDGVARMEAHLEKARVSGVAEGGILAKYEVEQILTNEDR